MSTIHIEAGETSCRVVKTEIHNRSHLDLPITADRLLAMLDEVAKQPGERRVQIENNGVRVDLDEHQFIISQHPGHFIVTLREFVRGIEVNEVAQ